MYALASGLVGFPSSSLRVRVVRTDARYVWVVTADLLDAGTPLTLNAGQVAPLDGRRTALSLTILHLEANSS